MRTPYSSQWNFSIQRQLPSNLLLDLSYVGSNSVKLLQSRQENRAIPGPGPVQARRPNPKYTALTMGRQRPALELQRPVRQTAEAFFGRTVVPDQLHLVA